MSFWDQMVAELESLGQIVAEWLPRVVVALVVLIVGRWIIGWIRKLAVKFLEIGAMQKVFETSGITASLKTSDQSAAGIVGTILYAYMYIALWLIVVGILQIATLETLLENFLVWVPTILLAGVVIVIAAAVGSWVSDIVKPLAEPKGVGWMALVAHVAIIIFGVLFALDLLEVTFAQDITVILVAAMGVAFAIAFGVGGIDTAKKWWEKYGSPKERPRDSGYTGG